MSDSSIPQRLALIATLFMVATVVGEPAANGIGQLPSPVDTGHIRVILLGTAGGPTVLAQRFGIGTLVLANRELLLFDCGRGVPTGIVRASVPLSDVTKVFLTHLHSDHVIALPELYLFPWAAYGRAVPLQVWGPDGTKAMMANLQKTFAFDIHTRRDVDEKFSAEGIKAVAADVHEGKVYQANGVTVTAFLVDHAPVRPAFGYRVEYGGHSVVMSGDTRSSDSVVRAAEGSDLLIHEVGRWKDDPSLQGPADERLPSGTTRGQARIIAEHHTDPVEAGRVFERAKPKLAVFSHYNPAFAPTIISLVRRGYQGRVELGEDGMVIDIGETITVQRAEPR